MTSLMEFRDFQFSDQIEKGIHKTIQSQVKTVLDTQNKVKLKQIHKEVKKDKDLAQKCAEINDEHFRNEERKRLEHIQKVVNNSKQQKNQIVDKY